MCGIVGYIGAGKTTEVLLDSLGRLEYRGYDSAGIALVCEDGLEVIKSAERIVKLKEQVPSTLVRVRGHRPHTLGHPRQAVEGQRAPAPGLLGPHRRRPQRHHRELPGAQARAGRPRPQVLLRDGYGSDLSPGRGELRRRHVPRRAGLGQAPPGLLRFRAHQQGRPGQDLRRPQGQPAGHRAGRRAVLPRLGRDGFPQAHQARRVHGGRRHRRALEGGRAASSTSKAVPSSGRSASSSGTWRRRRRAATTTSCSRRSTSSPSP